MMPPGSPPTNNGIASSKDLFDRPSSDTSTSLKNSLNLAFLPGPEGAASSPSTSTSTNSSTATTSTTSKGLPKLPPLASSPMTTTTNSATAALAAATSIAIANPIARASHHSVQSQSSITTNHKLGPNSVRGGDRGLAIAMPPGYGDSSSLMADDSTYCYNDDDDCEIDESGRDEEETLGKIMTMQSIDRLESHLPRIVVEQLIADMKQRREQVKLDKKSSPLARGAMTLEVPMPVLVPPESSAAVPASASLLPKAKPRNSVSAGSHSPTPSAKGGMSDLLNTLTSLDELLEEEFSSSDDGSSEEDSGASSDEDGSSSEEDDSGSEEESSSEEDSDEEEESEVENSGVTFFADDGVSDIDNDDGVSDIDDDTEHDFRDVAEYDDDLTCASDMRAERSVASGDSESLRSGGGYSRYLGSTCSSGGDGRRSLRSASKHMGSSAANPEFEVGKLRQGRLNNRRLESDTVADDRSMSVDLTTLSTKSEGNQSLATEVQASHHISAILFLDISGFTKLSRSLEVEALSEIINSYFETIVSEIKAYGGDILKFAGDALIVEWTKEMLPQGQQHLPVTLLAALCASKLVDKCSDYPVTRFGEHICTLNLHCALGYGAVVGAHCGDMDRMEYIILGDSIQQIANGMDLSQLGEVVASPEAMRALLEGDHVEFTEAYTDGQPHTLAFKHDQKFHVTSTMTLPAIKPRTSASSLCQNWSAQELEDLQRRMSRYVHSVVYSDEFSKEENMSASGHKTISMARTKTVKSGQSQSELRDVFTVFIQPKLTGSLNGESAGDVETLQLLNSILFIVNSEVTHYKAHLRQFIVDDKGLVVIANFGLRGSTFPNMIEERAIPCISNIKTLLKTELDMECKMGATYGKAYCGVVGGVTRHEYAILGPSVNLAARLMASKSNPGILVDEAVKNKAGERPFKSLPPVKAKGYDDLVKIYNPNENVRKAWKNVSAEFVGRQQEVESLMITAKSVMEESYASKTVFISGPYGIGKSYLISHIAEEIEHYIKAQKAPHHMSRLVFCEDDSFRPFSIVRPLFLGLLRRKQHVPSFGAAETAGHSESLVQKAEVEEAQLYVSLLQICLEAKIPMQYIEMFGGLIFSTKLSDIGTWSDRSRKMSEWNAIAKHLVTAVLHCTSDYRLVLLALDDVSGMDEMSWKILQRLYERANNLLVITTARNEFDLNINAEFWADLNEEGIDSGRFRHMRMSPMGVDDIGQLARKRLCSNMADMDTTLSKTVTSQSRGNPLLACEILDVMYRDDGCSDPDQAVSGAALSKIEELLLNRLDELAPLDRSHLNLGSILGFSFAEKDVVLVMEKYNDVREEDKKRHAKNVHTSLQESVTCGILKCTDDGYNVKYTFSHALWMKTIVLHILDAWKDEMRALIDVATEDGDICIRYDWDELAQIKADLCSMRAQNTSILQSISELRALINRAR
ncbi:cyclase type 10 [Seminavis robusta]|uniref:Cyclase type 10 n=1 Tax=Seminavis robusta TaxID=568900 RepID=A0A9N8F291_9STRA|nr:cyclase type 10 [Seminavis robusta]|eukprot:Sro3446_g348130.1 cyclase type 10 (1433) ;mRNA; r:314-4697